MLKGLEVSVARLSELERTWRIDSEFYKKENLSIKGILQKVGAFPLTDFVRVSDGNHMSISDNFCENGVPYYRGQDIHDFFIENANPVCIPEAIYKMPTMLRSHLAKGDVLLSIVGTIGEVSLVNTNKDATCSCKLAILRPKTEVNSEVIALFLQSKYGQNQIRKFIRGAVQMGFILEDVNQIYIPKFSDSFQSQIEQIVKSAHECLSKSKRLYSESEELLLSELDLKDWQPSNSAVNVKRLKDSFLQTGRLDAEFYQQKYEDYARLIERYRGGFANFTDVCKINDTNFNPSANVVYSYIELSNIGNFGEITGCTVANGADLPSRARRLIHTNDVIISSVEGSLKSCALVPKEYDGALCSTGFYVVKSEAINPETLLVLFKSEPMQNLLKQNCSGTILTAVSRNELNTIVVPKIKTEVQSEIAGYVQKSISLRAEAKSLLESAKTQVEEYITAIHGGGYNDSVNSAYEKLIQESISCYRMAEWLLLAELYADLWKAQTAVCFSVKTFSDFQEAGRLDAEYYQPKYDELSEKLSHYDCKMLGEIVSVKKSVEPGSECYQDDGIPFVRVSDITEFGIEETDLHLSPKEFSLEALRPHKDTILLSKDGSVGIAYKCETDLDIITSGALLHLTVHDGNFLPDYVTLVLNSIAVKMQAERDSNGAIIQHWKPDDIKRVVIPCLALSVQKTITEKIQQSFALRAESKRLLKQAKRMVESEIEGGNW